MLANLKSRFAIAIAGLGIAGLLAVPAGATALYATVSGEYDAISDPSLRQLWEDLTDFSAADLATGGSFTGTVYIDKVTLGEPPVDNNPSPTTASFNPFPGSLSMTAPSLAAGSFISLTLSINGNTFNGGKEPIPAGVFEYKLEEILGRNDSSGTDNDSLSFTTNLSGLNLTGNAHARSISYTFEGVPFVDEVPDPLNPPLLSQLTFDTPSTMIIASLITPNESDTGDILSTLTGRITGASDLMTLDQLLSQSANSGGTPTQTGTGKADDPLLPVFGDGETPDGTYNFTIDNIGLFGLGTNIPIFIDPEIAIGYTFSVEVGDPLFASVVLPTLPDTNNQFIVQFGSETVNVAPGGTVDFTTLVPAGVESFTVTDIMTDPPLDPNDPTAFMAGVTFVDNSTTGSSASVTMAAITQTISDPGGHMDIPEPGTLGLSALGLVAIWRLRRRNRLAA